MTTSPESLAYAESVRAIEQQSRMVDELRSRTGVLLTGASIVASFLGAEALRGGSNLTTLAALALIAFAAVLAASVAILWPREWRWSLGAKVLLEDWADEPARRDDVGGMLAFVATTLEKNWRANDRKLDEQLRLFQVAAIALGVEVVLWTLELA